MCYLFYTEISSASGSNFFIRSPDFHFLIDYPSLNDVIIFRSYGPGCINRIFATYTWKKWPQKCPCCGTGNYLVVTLDDAKIKVTYSDILVHSKYPFVVPLNKNTPGKIDDNHLQT